MRDVKSRLRNIVATGLPRNIWQLISQPKNTMRDIKSRLRNIVAAGLPRDIWQLISQPKKHNARYKIAISQYRSSGFTPRHLANLPTENTMRDVKSRLRNRSSGFTPRHLATNLPTEKHNARYKIATSQYRSSGFTPRLLCK